MDTKTRLLSKRKISSLVLICSALSGFVYLQACSNKEPAIREQDLRKFYEMYEKGEYTAALESLPADILTVLPYTEEDSAETLYERDEPIYTGIITAEPLEKDLYRKDRDELEVQYHLGVIHYWLGDLEKAKYKFLLCLRADPIHRMAHIYLFRIFRRLEQKLIQIVDPETQSITELYFQKLGYGNSDLHYDMATRLVSENDNSQVPVIEVSFTFDDGEIKDFDVSESTDFNPDQRGVLNRELDETELYRIELIGNNRHVLDEAFFPSRQIIYWDGVDESGKMVGGQEIEKTFYWSSPLIKIQNAEKLVIYGPEGKKILEHTFQKK